MTARITRPLITEQTFKDASRGWYTFAVDLSARKEQIASEIADMYRVDVLEVRTATMHGKARRAGRRAKHVMKPDWKKARILVKPGQKIDAFEVSNDSKPEAKPEAKAESKIEDKIVAK